MAVLNITLVPDSHVHLPVGRAHEVSVILFLRRVPALSAENHVLIPACEPAYFPEFPLTERAFPFFRSPQDIHLFGMAEWKPNRSV